jgi:integrase
MAELRHRQIPYLRADLHDGAPRRRCQTQWLPSGAEARCPQHNSSRFFSPLLGSRTPLAASTRMVDAAAPAADPTWRRAAMSIEARTTRSGERRYEVRLRHPDGREYSRSFRTRKDAERYQATERADRSRGNWIDPRGGATTFGAWAAEWLASDPAKSPSALARDRSIVRAHLLKPLAPRRVASITRRDVQALVTVWTSESKPRSVRRQYDTLRAILNAAVEADLVARTPCRGIRLPEWNPSARPVLDADQLARLAAVVGPDLGLTVYLGGVLGLRWGEVAGLRVSAIDFAQCTVTVAEQRTRGLGGVMITRQPKTNAGRRTVTAPDWLMELVATHLARRPDEAGPNALLFVTAEGEGMDYSHWRQRVWIPATQAAGLAGLQFHDLRRTAATALVQEHIDMKTAQVRLGHADPRTTLGLYAQATSQADRSAAHRLGERFRPPDEEPAAIATTNPRGMDAGSTAGHTPRSRGKHPVTRGDAGREGGIRTRGLSVPNAAR